MRLRFSLSQTELSNKRSRFWDKFVAREEHKHSQLKPRAGHASLVRNQKLTRKQATSNPSATNNLVNGLQLLQGLFDPLGGVWRLFRLPMPAKLEVSGPKRDKSDGLSFAIHSCKLVTDA